MIIVHRQTADQATPSGNGKRAAGDSHPLAVPDAIPPDAIWLDLMEPTNDEDRKIERELGINVPTRADLTYVEPAESLYSEDGIRYLSAQIIADARGMAVKQPVTFILTETKILTVRYHKSEAFEQFTQRLTGGNAVNIQPETVLAGLINTIVNFTAAGLDSLDLRLEEISEKVFSINETSGNHNTEFKSVLSLLGRESKRISNIRESLVSIERVLLFLSPDYRTSQISKSLREDVRSTLRDLQSLEEHATFQAQKAQFLLDTTLGLINLEQSHIIKLFSVLAVIFMPPTVIASIYGMNFDFMPELKWHYGYPMSLFFMVLSAAALYGYFRRQRWL